MAKQYLKIFTDFATALDPLQDAEVGRLFKAMLQYAETGEVPSLSGNERFVWPTAKLNIDRSRAAYQSMCERNKKNIAKRYDSLPEATKAYETLPVVTSGYQSKEEKEKDKDKEKEKKKESVNGKLKRPTAFVPPTLQEVEEYARSRNSSVDPKRFWDYFNAGDWKDAKGQPVRSWKQKFITWESKSGERKKEASGNIFLDILNEERSYD